MMAMAIQPQTGRANGRMIRNNLSELASGRVVRIPAPSSMKGFVKSITLSRKDVIVKGPMANAISCE